LKTTFQRTEARGICRGTATHGPWKGILISKFDLGESLFGRLIMIGQHDIWRPIDRCN